MKVLLNGSSYSLKDNCSLDSLIKNLELDGKYAVEINQNIIPRSQYRTKKISNKLKKDTLFLTFFVSIKML